MYIDEEQDSVGRVRRPESFVEMKNLDRCIAKRITQPEGTNQLASSARFIDFSDLSIRSFGNEAGEVIVKFGVKKPSTEILMPKAEISMRRMRKLIRKKFKKPS